MEMREVLGILHNGNFNFFCTSSIVGRTCSTHGRAETWIAIATGIEESTCET
jgi:hypothetical protein